VLAGFLCMPETGCVVCVWAGHGTSTGYLLAAGGAPWPNGEPGPGDHLRKVFYRMGFNDQEIVALSGESMYLLVIVPKAATEWKRHICHRNLAAHLVW